MTESHPLIRRLVERLSEGADEPLGRLIVDEVWLAAVEGTVATGARMPTARLVAITLGVSPRVVENAYRELEERGVLATRVGEGSFISLQLPSDEERGRYRQLAELCDDVLRRAGELGFGLDDVIDGLSDYRTLQPRKESL